MAMFNKEIFSTQLTSLRITKAVMAKDVAAAIGITRASMSQLESGLNAPSLNTLLALCRYFNVSADYLLGLTDEPRPLHSDGHPAGESDNPARR